MYCQLYPSTHRIEGIEFGLLRTVTTQETPHYEAEITETGRRKAANGNSHSLNLIDYAIRGMLPTPTAMDSTGATANMKSTQVKEGSMHSVTLSRWAATMLPTPTASENNDSQLTPTQGKKMDKGGRVLRRLATLDILPIGKTSQLNPRFVAEMMGFPPNWTELPFQNGETNL
jgi:hypothetical protein